MTGNSHTWSSGLHVHCDMIVPNSCVHRYKNKDYWKYIKLIQMLNTYYSIERQALCFVLSQGVTLSKHMYSLHIQV